LICRAGGCTTTAAPPAPLTNNNFLTYVNALNKISIQYPSTWAKTESIVDSHIPVIFNAPVVAASAATAPPAATKTFMISMDNLLANNPQQQTASPLGSYTQKQIYALTHSNTKYSISDANISCLSFTTLAPSCFALFM
jgi:hypothetical protein